MLALATGSFPASPQGWLDVLILLSIKSTLVLALAGIVTLALSRASAAARHLAWSAALVGLLALPPLALWAPSIPVTGLDVPRPSAAIPARRVPLVSLRGAEVSPTEARDEGASAVRTSPTRTAADTNPLRSAPVARRGIDWTAAILGGWALGAALLIGWLLLGWWMSRRLSWGSEPAADVVVRELHARCARELGLRRPIELRTSARTPVPCTYGLLRPRVLLPEMASTWPAERLRVVLLHELAHVARRDCLMQTLAQLACALFWFNPLAWYAARRLRIERERACDDRVLECDTEAADYAEHLLAVVRAMRGHGLSMPGAVAFARPSQFEGRLLAVLDERRPRGVLTAARVRRAAGLATLVVLPLALLRPWAAPASANLTLVDDDRARPERAAPSEVVQAPESEKDLERRLEWALTEGGRKHPRGYWVAYAIPRGARKEDMSDSGPIDLRTLSHGWTGPRMADVLAGKTMRDEGVAPDDRLRVMSYHFTGRGASPRDVDRIRVQTMGLAADFGREPLYWLGRVEDAESFDWARRVEDAARTPHLRVAALEAVALHGDDDVVRAHLREVLKSPAPSEVRSAATERLGRFSDPGTLDLLSEALHDRDADVRQAALEAFGQMRSPQSVRVLSALARDSRESEEIRRGAVEALGEKAGDDEAMHSLEDLIDDSGGEGAKGGMRASGQDHGTTMIVPRADGQDIVVLDDRGRPEVTIQQRQSGQKSKESKRTIKIQREQKEESAHQTIQRQAVESLGNFPAETSLPRLVRIAHGHDDVRIRRQAIESIADLGTDEALRTLLHFAWDPREDTDLAGQAVEGIAQFDGGGPKLCDLAENHRSAEVRRRAVESLGDVHPEARVLATLDRLARNDPSEDVQRQAVESIAQMPEDLSLPRLEKLARSHPNVDVRRQAIEALGDLDPAKAAPILESLIREKDSGR